MTDRGLRHVRNEDAMALAATPEAAIAVVSDGVSDSSRPDQASLAAVRTALRVLLAAAQAGQDAVAGLSGRESMAEASARAAASAQEAVSALSGARPGGTHSTRPADAPSATFASAVVTAGTVTVCWLGDSRAYWLDAGQPSAAKQLSRDDSLAAEMVSAGLLSEAEATSAEAHVVTGWLGADTGQAAPHVASFTPPGAGAVLVCTDGLWNYEPEAEKLAVRALPAALRDPLGAARDLVDFALSAGGRDNVTVVLVPFPLAGSAGPARTYPDDLKEMDDE
jgi:serine/threonine protein phosphatase PrpC